MNIRIHPKSTTSREEIDHLEDFLWGTIRKTILGLRLKNKNSLNDLRKILGHSSLTTLSRFENGLGKIKFSEIYIICMYYNFDINKILPRIDELPEKFEIFLNDTKTENVDSKQLNQVAENWVKGNELLSQIAVLETKRRNK